MECKNCYFCRKVINKQYDVVAGWRNEESFVCHGAINLFAVDAESECVYTKLNDNKEES